MHGFASDTTWVLVRTSNEVADEARESAMCTIKFFVPIVLATAILAAPSRAHADPTESGATPTGSSTSTTNSRLAALRQGVRELNARTKAVRALMEHATPQLRRHSRRVLVVVEQDQMSITARLDILQVTTAPADEPKVRAMEATYAEAVKLLARVESWYPPTQS